MRQNINKEFVEVIEKSVKNVSNMTLYEVLEIVEKELNKRSVILFSPDQDSSGVEL